MGWGLFHEFIAFPCGARLSMPLGVIGWDPGFFRVYPGTRMYEMYRGGPLLLLYPRDPLLFVESVDHKLESKLDYSSPCPTPVPDWGVWYSCLGTPLAVGGGEHWYSCTSPSRLGGEPPLAYTRFYGCLVEALVYYTKVRAGIHPPGGEGFLEGLEWCMVRSSRGDEHAVRAARRLLRAIRQILSGREGGEGGL